MEAYQQRLQRMATELARLLAELPAASTRAEEGLGAGSSSSSSSAARDSGAGESTSSRSGQGGERSSGASGPSSEAVLQVLRRYLFEQQGFRAAGRSALPGQGAAPINLPCLL